MADQVIIVTWCDPCMAAGKDSVVGVPYVINGTRVDLCPEHSGPAKEALEIARTWGRPEGPQEAAGSASDLRTCPDCGGTFKGLTGIAMHRRRTHGILGAKASKNRSLNTRRPG